MVLACAITLGACSDNVATDGPLGGSLRVTGDVVDFQTGSSLAGATSVTTSGLLPAPQVTSQGSSFTIDGIPENSTFQILAAAPPTHRSTFSTAVVLTSSDLDGVKAPVVSEQFLGMLATSFGVTPTAAKGVLFVRIVDGAGVPKAGVAGSNLVITGGVIGPKFLDANLAPQPNATASSSSGWAVFFEVPTGIVTLGQAATATVTLDMASSPINAGAVTLADAAVTTGPSTMPTNVSLANHIVPIFTNRGCIACHAGGGAGKDLGGLNLAPGDHIYKELVTEKLNTRVQLATPENSWLLTFPSREDPPDRHPNNTFASPSDPDYIKILVWIREGAKQN